MTLPISQIDQDPGLREKAKALTLEQLKTDKIQTLIDDMIPTMYKADGIGLAAPQVGQSLRITVIAITDDEQLILVNPEITFMSKKTQTMEEGCLSVPNLKGPVERADKIRFKAWDRDGKPFKMKAKGMLARVVQHELDHLNGVLFIDHVAKEDLKRTND